MQKSRKKRGKIDSFVGVFRGAGSGRVMQNSFVISVFPLGVPVVNEAIFLYIYHYKIPRVARELYICDILHYIFVGTYELD